MSSVEFPGHRLCSRDLSAGSHRTGSWNTPGKARETRMDRRGKNMVQLQRASADPTGNSGAGMASQSCIG